MYVIVVAFIEIGGRRKGGDGRKLQRMVMMISREADASGVQYDRPI